MPLTRSVRGAQQEPPTTTTGTIPNEPGGGGLSGAADEILGNLGAGSGAPQPLGVGVGFRAAAPRQYATGYYPHGYSYSRGSFAPGSAPSDPYVSRSGALGIPARYKADDEYAPANMSPTIIRDLQQQMAFLGLYDSNAQITPGDWGEETASAFRRLLSYSNQHGMTYRVALSHMRSQVEGGQGIVGRGIQGNKRMRIDEFGNLVDASTPPTREPLVTRTTDPKTLEIMFRETSMNLLGQALAPDQVQMMSQAYNQMEVQRQQEAYDKQLAGGSVIDVPSPEAFGQAQIEEQNPQGVAAYRGLQYMNEAMSMLASPAWGV